MIKRLIKASKRKQWLYILVIAVTTTLLSTLARSEGYIFEKPQYLSSLEGDSLSKIAQDLRTHINAPEPSLYQIMVAIFQANPHAFENGDMNKLIANQPIFVPEHDTIVAISDAQAYQRIMSKPKASVSTVPRRAPVPAVETSAMNVPVNQPSPMRPSHSMAAQQATVTMDFNNVDVQQVINFIAELTGKNFVIDPNTRGRVTVITPEPVTRKEAMQLFEAVMQTAGFTIIPGIGADRIIATKKIRSDATPVTTTDSRGAQVVARIIKLNHTDARSIATTFKPLVNQWGYISAVIDSNAIIVVDTKDVVYKISKMLKEVDSPEGNVVLRAYPIRYANLNTIEKHIKALFQEHNKKRPKGISGMTVVGDVGSKTLFVSAPLSLLPDIEVTIADMDTEPDNLGKNIHIYYPENGQAEEMAKVLNELLGKIKADGSDPVNFGRKISIVAEKTVNALVVVATPEDYQRFLPIVRGLDIPKLQVYIQVAVVEIQDSDAFNLGVDWQHGAKGDGDVNFFGGSQFNGISGINIDGTSTSGTSTVTNDVRNILEGVEGLRLGLLDLNENPALSVIINALKRNVDTNVLATPNILVLDNEEAEIAVGQNVPFRTGSTTNDVGTTELIERKDVGLILRITPQVLTENKIMLKIFQENSGVSTSSTVTDDLVTDKKSLDTKVMVGNGQAVVLGGLIDEKIEDTVRKVPILGSIPLVGLLFRSTVKTKERRNLMVFINPRIINSDKELEKITKKKFELSRKDWLKGAKGPTDVNQLPERVEDLSAGTIKEAQDFLSKNAEYLTEPEALVEVPQNNLEPEQPEPEIIDLSRTEPEALEPKTTEELSPPSFEQEPETQSSFGTQSGYQSPEDAFAWPEELIELNQ